MTGLLWFMAGAAAGIWAALGLVMWADRRRDRWRLEQPDLSLPDWVAGDHDQWRRHGRA